MMLLQKETVLNSFCMLSGYNEYCSNVQCKEIHHTQLFISRMIGFMYVYLFQLAFLFKFLLALCLKASTEPKHLLPVINIGILLYGYDFYNYKPINRA
jgi:hypothetical protein